MSSVAKPDKTAFERLPTNVLPVNYELTLTPDLEKFTFDGEEKISLKISETTDKIKLNVNEINILQEKSSILSQNKNLSIQKIDYDVANETATLHLAEPLQPGSEAVLNLKFTGILNDKMKGFYRSKYTGPDGKVRHCAVTQFESTDARRAFPCWDEPAHKATFDVTLVVPKGDNIKALSNMAVLSESSDADKRVVKFTKTPIMSTYLVAFVVGEFDYIETKSAGGVLVRVYTPIGKSGQGKFALDVCARALDFYKNYFQIAYPLNKMDLIAISDFSAGAMENWGLVTYRETCLLVDPANTSTVRRQYVALVVAHELAHQWFGNLVTMEWWTHLWLNEGFATFIEYLCVDEIFPNYNIWTQFVADVFLEAMELDGLDNSHPIEVPVGHPSEVDEIFDTISYSKGASVIRMLHKYIGDETFRSGMHLYLSRHSFKNTQTEDLWDALEEASKKPVRRVMSTWTKQKGYPVITVGATLDPATNSRVITLSQEKFNLNGQLSDEDRKSLWAVPISIITSSSNNKPVAEALLEERTLTLTLSSSQLGPDEWFKLNPSTVGTYRVSYSPELLNQFSVGIVNQSVPALDRLGLLNDLFALVLAGKQSTLDLLRFINAFRKENNYTVWIALNSILGKFDQLFAETEFHQQFRKFGRDLVNENAFPWIGWSPKPNEPYLDTLLRSVIINRLVGFEDDTVLTECGRLFEDHVSGKSLIPADLRSAVYRGVAIRGDQSTFDTFLKLYHQSDLQEEKNRCSGALGWLKDEKLIDRVLDFALSDDVRSQDTVFVISTVSANILGREKAWNYFQQHKKTFADRYDGGFLIARLVKLLCDNFITEQRATEVEQFFVDNHFPGTERTVQQASETIRLNAQILKRDTDSVRTYLQSL